MSDPKTPLHQWTHKGDKVLVLKCVSATMRGHGNFPYPESGTVECPGEWLKEWGGEKPENWRPEWEPDQKCGGGLHGWAWGVGVGDGLARRGAKGLTAWTEKRRTTTSGIGIGPGRQPSLLLFYAREVRKALVACAVLGWAGVLLHFVMQWIAEGAR